MWGLPIGTAPAADIEFDRWWNSPGRWVEPVNQRRGGESGVQLLQDDPAQPPLFCKRQTGHTYRTLRHPFGRPTILRELQAYRAFSRLGVKTPDLVYCAARRRQGRWQAVLVTKSLQGFVSLTQWYDSNTDTALGKTVLQRLATALARLHLARWQHGCCYPKHIFVKAKTSGNGVPQAEIAMIDLEKSRRRWRFKSASQHDLRQLERHRGNMPETDLLFMRQAYTQALECLPEVPHL